MTATLTDWKITGPDRGHLRLVGTVFGHPAHADGKQISTGIIEGYNPQNDAFISASGTCYKLEEPDANYAKLCPDAKRDFRDRFFNAQHN